MVFFYLFEDLSGVLRVTCTISDKWTKTILKIAENLKNSKLVHALN